MTSTPQRRNPNRASLQRRSTKGPLDEDDPLSDPLATATSPIIASTSPLPRAGDVHSRASTPLASSIVLDRSGSTPAPTSSNEKDLSFLLDPSTYHPLGQLDVPAPFRKQFSAPPSAGTDISQVFARLESLLSECNFLEAAHLAAMALTSAIVSPTDITSIFRLLSIRYSSLELSGGVLLAAQEAKALEDLASSFYFFDNTLPENTASMAENIRPRPKHIMPFDLRLQALRLQSIGFSDPRRGISALYDLGQECRENLAAPVTSAEDSLVWEQRLEEVGLRVVNALIEMGDIDCAARTLSSLRPSDESNNTAWTSRMILLHLKMGHIAEARNLLQRSKLQVADEALLGSLLTIADGHLDDAVEILSQTDQTNGGTATSMAKQNLAVAYLYTGQITKCRNLLNELVDEGESFQTLTINLATIFELSSEKAQDLKVALVGRVADHEHRAKPFVNADFKL